MLVRSFTMLSALTIFLTAFIGCKKDNDKTTDLRIHLTDNPYNASEVNVDIREINVKFHDDDPENWVTLPAHTGIYNLLDFQNGIDTVIAQGIVPAGVVKEIRFVLGDANSITIDNVNYPLTIPSGSESGLKIKLNKQLNANIDSLIIDFDAALSIFQTGTDEYKLKPVLKIK